MCTFHPKTKKLRKLEIFEPRKKSEYEGKNKENQFKNALEVPKKIGNVQSDRFLSKLRSDYPDIEPPLKP